jgi:hypothetical protein
MKVLAIILALFVLGNAELAHAACPTGSVVVRGRVDNPPGNAIVRVQLIYAQNQVEDSTDTTLENPNFTIKVPFYTQSRGPKVNGLLEKCNRKPRSVVVMLLQGDDEQDRFVLDLTKDFDSPFPNGYTLRSPVVLKGRIP